MYDKILLHLDSVERIMKGEFVAPINCSIDTTIRCNLNCSYCIFAQYRQQEIQQKHTDLDILLYKRLVEELWSLGTKSITFAGGGEPLLHPEIHEIMYTAFNTGFQVGLLTNGTLLHRIDKELLSKCTFIRISLDAADAETYKAIKGVDAYDITIENIKYVLSLKQHNLPTVGISCVICPQNKNVIKDIEKLGSQLGVDYTQIKPDTLDLEPFQEKDRTQKREDNSIVCERYHKKDKLTCSIAGLAGIISARGDVYYCCLLRGHPKYKLGNLHEKSFKTIWSRRPYVEVDYKDCSPYACKYANYADKCRKVLTDEVFATHKNFL